MLYSAWAPITITTYYNNRRRFDLPCLFPARSKRQKAKGNIATGTEPNEGIGTVLVAEVAACFCSTALSSTWGKRKAIHRKTIKWLRLRLLKQKKGRRCSKCPSLVRNYFESVSLVSAASSLNAHSLPDISRLHCHLLRLLTRSSFSLPHIGHTNAVSENHARISLHHIASLTQCSCVPSTSMVED